MKICQFAESTKLSTFCGLIVDKFHVKQKCNIDVKKKKPAEKIEPAFAWWYKPYYCRFLTNSFSLRILIIKEMNYFVNVNFQKNPFLSFWNV